MMDKGDNAVVMVENLSEQIEILQLRVEQLSTRLQALEQGKAATSPLQQPQATPSAAPPAMAGSAAGAPQALPPLFDTSALLPRISTICFLLVIALILRTITDNQIIDTRAGSILGMAYACVLILLGWRLYAKNSRLAPVFPGCGILLLFSIVLETHKHYGSLSTDGAYTILFLAGATVFALSIRYRASYLICLGVPGAAATAMAIDFPYPDFHILSLLLLSAIIAASYAFKQQMCRYLRWFTLLLATLFWLLWTSKMNTIPNCAEPVAEAMDPDWFFPMLFCFWGVYLATVILNVLNKELRLGFFESVIPTVTAAGAFGAGYVAVRNWFQEELWFYGLMVVIATLHLVIAWWLSRRDREQSTGVNVFILAGACLIVLTSATFFKHIGFILPVWSASALGLALLSAYLHNEGVRVTSYLLQATACFTAISSGAVLVPAQAPVAAGLAGISLCLFSLVQYNWSRSHAPDPSHSFFFSKLDTHNYSATLLLVIGLLGGYFFAQLVLYQGLSSMASEFMPRFKSGQSLIINTGALILLYIALKRRNREILLIGSMVALTGAGKVFIFDLLGIKGMPLVLSVFSTGVVAAFGSVVMGRWQKKEAEPA
ncbi:MAG: DUF2339 domain-containing protein [Desulfobulbaceae bacterium]|nr:DUF2339 domain-containing protein [Desulfobulbaceae bacterium]